MINRNIYNTVKQALARQAAVVLLGPRQVGKTTLALDIAQEYGAIYLDLENPADRERLREPLQFFEAYHQQLIILDEIHRVPELFNTLRGVIDKRRREGFKEGQFLLLGSAAIDLLRQTGESLAGRVSYIEMGPITVSEIERDPQALINLWIRGGFPDSYLARDDAVSFALREDFIRTYLERDVPMFGPRIPSETLRRLWTMLAHNHGALLNASSLAESLSISYQTVLRYTDLLVDLLLVRRLSPFHGNIQKRLVKTPKTYIKDTGLLHALLNISTYYELLGHPILGASWEGFVIENIISHAPKRSLASFYRTSAGAEIDLILELPNGKIWVIEIKSSQTPKLNKGFYHAVEDVKPDRMFIVYTGNEPYPFSKEIDVISLRELVREISLL